MRYLLGLLSIFIICNAKAQRTSAYYQFSINPQFTQVNCRSRVQPINSTEHYWILNTSNGYDSIRTITMVGSSAIIKPYTIDIHCYEKSPSLIFLMNKDKITWNLLLTPSGGGRGLYILNSQVVGEDMYLYCSIAADSLKIQLNQGKSTSFNVPDSSMYTLLKISKSGTCAIENFFMPLSKPQSKLIAINNKSYTVYFPIDPGYDWYKSNLDKNLVNKIVADTLLSGIFMQFDLGNRNVKNWISGTFPTRQYPEDNSYISTTNKLFLPGKYHGIAATFKLKFPYNPVYKINSNTPVFMKKPLTFSNLKTYLYWTLIDLDKWAVDEVKFNLIQGSNAWDLSNYGVLKTGYWFESMALTNVAVEKPITMWQTLSGSVFTYNTKTQNFVTKGFPPYTDYAEQDGDSLIFIAGGRLGMAGPAYINFDSDTFHYYIAKGFYCAEYSPDAKMVWARYGNITLNENRFDRFKTMGGGKLLTSTQSYMSDLDFGFRSIRKINIGDNSGYVMLLSRAPIADFDIENIENNHITLNYKGALNANFYYKYGDGSKDSNMNQRYFVHDYKKTGSFILYCIAKNAFGSDTAYYAVDVWDIASAKKLQKSNQIAISPNPSTGLIQWDIENTTSVDIFNLNGQLMQRTSTQSNNLNISMLPAQTYLVVVHNPTGSFCNKVVKVD